MWPLLTCMKHGWVRIITYKDYRRPDVLTTQARNGSRKIMCHASSHKTGSVKQSKLMFWSEGKHVYSDYKSR